MCTVSKSIWTMHFKCPQQGKSLATSGEVTDILKVFLNHVLQCPGNAKISGYEVHLCHF